jgi:hypothetical protein
MRKKDEFAASSSTEFSLENKLTAHPEIVEGLSEIE